MSRGLVIGMLVGALFEFGPTLRAQSNLATLVGTVKDASGGVVPNAAVAVKNLGTGLERSAKSDASGDYSVPNLQVGHYSLTVTLTGFETTTIPDIELQVGQTARVDPKIGRASGRERGKCTTGSAWKK